jgi:hypothetical protein
MDEAHCKKKQFGKNQLQTTYKIGGETVPNNLLLNIYAPMGYY